MLNDFAKLLQDCVDYMLDRVAAFFTGIGKLTDSLTGRSLS